MSRYYADDGERAVDEALTRIERENRWKRMAARSDHRKPDPWDACLDVDPFTGQPDGCGHGDACEACTD